MSDVPEGYDPTQYERPSVTVDVIIFTLRAQDFEVLLIQRGHPPYEGYWAFPGGFVDMEESLEAAALRELEEETGVRDVYIEQLHTFGDPDRDPRTRVITVAYMALVPHTALERPTAGDDATAARWWSVYDLPPLAFDHADILNFALTRVRYQLENTAVGFELLPERFTLSELESAYEVILGEELDRESFRSELSQAHIIEPVPAYRSTEHDHDCLYRFTDEAVARVRTRRLFP
jgi:8-oxo-dGTP diphosphatase